MPELVTVTEAGLYCVPGRFHIDPWQPVERAVLTHAHADHARPHSQHYLATPENLPLLHKRLGEDAPVEPLPYGEARSVGECTVSLHPAGHILGSAQVRIEHRGEVWVVSGDYKRDPDPTCAPFEVIPCDTFITEATFGLPIYRWEDPRNVVEQVHAWWQGNAALGRCSVLFCYALGKAQRILAGLIEHTDSRVLLHGAVDAVTTLYRQAGVQMVPTGRVVDTMRGKELAGELVLAPPSAAATPWMKRFSDCQTGFASGWMRVRGHRRRRGHDKGFILSDHADWPALLRTVKETGASRVLVTHGSSHALARFLDERGTPAAALETRFEGEAEA